MSKRPQDTPAEEPDGGNPHIRFRGGPGLGDRPGLLNKLQISRRGLLVGAAAIACAGRVALAAVEGVAGGDADPQAPRSGAGAHGSQAKGDAAKRLAALEKGEGGRLGVE